MGSFDSVTWQALTLLLTVAGVVGTVLLWRARGAASGLRALGVTTLVPAAYLTGTMRLLWEVGDAVVSWAVGLAFSPTMWFGIALAAAAGGLIASGGLVARRQGGSGRGRARGAVTGSPETPPAVTSPGSRPARGKPGSGDDGLEDMDDIEAILRRHGIS